MKSRATRPINHILHPRARVKKSPASLVAGTETDRIAGLRAVPVESGIAIPTAIADPIFSPEEAGAALTRIRPDITPYSPPDFFRDARALNHLERVIRTLLKDHPGDRPFRVWVPGCGTGQEVYSIAMCVLEAMPDWGVSIPVQIFGTDMDQRAILFARRTRPGGSFTISRRP